MSFDTLETWSVKKIMQLHRAIGILDSPDMMNKIIASGPLSDDVRELIDLGLAASAANATLNQRLAAHQAAYDAMQPMQLFQTLEAVYRGDDTWDDAIKYGVYEARTAKEAMALANAAGETQVTHARPLNQSELLARAAQQVNMTVIEQSTLSTPADELVGFPKVEDALEKSTREHNEEIELRTRVFGAPD